MKFFVLVMINMQMQRCNISCWIQHTIYFRGKKRIQHNITLLQSQLNTISHYYSRNSHYLPNIMAQTRALSLVSSQFVFFFFGRKEFRPIVMTMAYTFVFLECIYISEKKSNILFEKPKKRRWVWQTFLLRNFLE